MKHYLFFLFITAMVMSCKSKEKFAVIETDYGNMKVMLYDSTPIHTENFIKLAKEGYYDGLLFHRVINGFMIQGGDPESRDAEPSKRLGGGGPGYTLDAEIKGYHVKGALAAARQGDQVNPEKKSSGSQFYIVHGRPIEASQLQMIEQQKGIDYPPKVEEEYMQIGGAPFLDKEYTVFGRVVEGLDVIDKIAEVQTMPGDRPVEDVKMTVRILD